MSVSRSIDGSLTDDGLAEAERMTDFIARIQKYRPGEDFDEIYNSLRKDAEADVMSGRLSAVPDESTLRGFARIIVSHSFTY